MTPQQRQRFNAFIQMGRELEAQAGQKSFPNQRPHGSQFTVHGETVKPSETVSVVVDPNRDPAREALSAKEETAARLLEKYGDLMGIADHHPVFAAVRRDWNTHPQTLTLALKERVARMGLAGILEVIEDIRAVRNYPAAKNKGAFLRAVFQTGRRPQMRGKAS